MSGYCPSCGNTLCICVKKCLAFASGDGWNELPIARAMLADCENSLNAINSAMINGDWKYAETVTQETLTRLRERK